MKIKNIFFLTVSLSLFSIINKDWENEWKYGITTDEKKEVDSIFIHNMDSSAEEILKKYPSYKFQIFANVNIPSAFINSCPKSVQDKIAISLINQRKKHPAYDFSDLLGSISTDSLASFYKILGIIMGGSYLLQTFVGPILGPKFHRWYRKYLFKSDIKPENSIIQWDDIIGLSSIKKELEDIAQNIKKQKISKQLEKNNHILFYGTPGNGKTFVAQAFANKLNVPYFYISMSKLFEDKDSIQLTFEKLSSYAKQNKTPIIVFIDEIDLIIPSRKQKSISAEEKQQLQNFLSILDGKESMDGVLIVVNTNNKDDLDDALLRDGRIGVHIEFANPNENDIKELFIHFAKEFNLVLADEIDYNFFIEKNKQNSISKIKAIVKNLASHIKKNTKNNTLENNSLYNFFN